MKTIEIEVSTACGTGGLPPQLLALAGKKTTWSADEHNAFGLIAIVTAPPMYVGFSLADTWAHHRYLAAVDPFEKHLALRQEWKDLDPHQKTILADDWGMGFPLLYLMESLDLVHFAPTDYWVKSLELTTGTKLALKKGKRGPPKLPDFVGIDTAGRYHAIECKGTQTSRSALASAIAHGVPQVENLRSPGALPPAMHACFDSWLVAGLYIPMAGKKTRPLLQVADPDFSALSSLIEQAGGIEAVGRAISLTALCQQLAAIGLRRLATVLFSGKAQRGDVDLVRAQADISDEAQGAGFYKTSDAWVADRNSQLFRPEGLDAAARIRQAKSSYSAPVELVESLTATITDSGVVDRQALDEILAGLLDTQDQHLESRRAPFNEGRRPTPWISAEEDGMSRLKSEFGIQIETVLEEH
ncbi:hypothetical protein LGM71_18870 [Burkholderia sp. AU33545]|uniref:hypothetical protein n=1 Tax=Burkholderia sp. AU33545 TaxID=2879631 RepID=UPI001CF51BAD|nr:hypothetical protein [Burkholderia sp. AU33545]MCA8203118.1 hypothetical protein [Burkholderia sp. AU33545]